MIGLVLQGGGAKGSYQIGVWQALRELNIEIAAVTGTSIGALNGALIVQDKFERAYQLWCDMDPGLVLKDEPDILHQLVTMNINIKNMSNYFEFLKTTIKQKGLDVEPLKELIKKEVDEDCLRNSPIDFGLVTISLTEWKAVELFAEDIEKGKIADYMLASAFLPGFKPMMIDGKRFLDGSFYDNLPINLMSKKNITEIVAVELDSAGRNQPVKDKTLSIRRIIPSGDLGPMLEFNPERSKLNIRMGYLDAMKSYGRYEGNAYFLEEVPDEAFFIEFIQSVSVEDIRLIAKLIGYNEGIYYRLLTEKILPELCEMLGFDITMTYKDIIIGVIEFLAQSFIIDRLKVYTYEELLSLVVQKSRDSTNRFIDISMMPNILRRQNLVQKTFKVDLLRNWLEVIMKSKLSKNEPAENEPAENELAKNELDKG